MYPYTIQLQQNPHPHETPKFCQDGFLFNEAEHLRQQNNGQFYLLTALNQDTQQTEARCAFFVQSDQAMSPLAAPFGSIEFAQKLPESILSSLIHTLVETTRMANVRRLRIVNYPYCYAPEQVQRLENQLKQHGFGLTEANPNSFLSITNQQFTDVIAPAERRRLRKCQEVGFQFKQWESPEVGPIITFLQKNRQVKGYQLTISPERLVNLFHDFPAQFIVFTLQDGDKLIALTITVRVREDILYSFLPASCPDYNSYSPMVMLTDGIFSYCQNQSIRLLDLGVSLDANRRQKPNLMRFKRNLGAQESPKQVFEKVL
ncbi:hypothetical protein GCM10028805_59200 [Spirosoma harenae]